MKRLWGFLLALVLLVGCSPAPSEVNPTLHILATTYPVYLFTTAVTEGVEGVEVALLVNQQTSCLHDYTLTVKDMRAIDRADIIVVNGAGLEEFMEDALRQKDAPVIDCSEGIHLLPAPDSRHHDGDEAEHGREVDPHFWMSHTNAIQMTETIGGALTRLTGTPNYRANASQAAQAIAQASRVWPDISLNVPGNLPELVTFHDGFQYFAQDYGLNLLKSIEEEEGAEASAKELREIIQLVQRHKIPAIFVEKNGSRRSAEVISRETGCVVCQLDMMMSGDGAGIQPYLQTMERNLTTVWEALG